jgi:regulator of protease activity HflC (stomatin/prohibitin superfamily)
MAAAGRTPAIFRLIGFGAIVLVLISIVTSSFYTIEQGQVGIKLRFGKLISVEQPGFGFKTPFIEDVLRMSTRTEKLQLPQIESYSKDIQAADLQISLNYHIDASRAGEVYTSLGLNYAERIIVPTTLRVTKEEFGQYNAQNIIVERAALGKKVEQQIAAELLPHGIIVEGFQMEDVSFSNAFEQSIEARMQAEVEVAKLRQNLDREKVQADIARTQAAGRADSLRAQAQAEADAMKTRAAAEAEAIQLRGNAEAKAITARGEALRGNAELVKLTQAERWNGELPTTMLPTGTLPMLDLSARSAQ